MMTKPAELTFSLKGMATQEIFLSFVVAPNGRVGSYGLFVVVVGTAIL